MPWLLLAVSLLCAAPAWAGKVRGAAAAARGESKASSSARSRANPPPSGRPADTSSTGGSATDSFYGFLFWSALRVPIILPQLILESRGPLPFVYEPKPYARRAKGIVRSQKLLADSDQLTLVTAEIYDTSSGPPDERAWMPGETVYQDPIAVVDEPSAIADESGDPPADEELVVQASPPVVEDWTSGGQAWAAQLSLDGALIDADTLRLRPRFRLFTPSRVELDAETSIYRESLTARDRTETGRDVDWMTVSTMHVAIRFAQSQAVQFRLGVGPRLMTTPDAAFMGWDLSYGFEAFPFRPFILAGSAGMGTVGKAFVTDLRASVGVVVSAVEIMVGGERLQIGDTVLGGPTAGVRLWF